MNKLRLFFEEIKEVRITPAFWIGVLLLLLYNHADYLWQGEMHGWKTWLDLTYRAPKWGFFDFIPHDLWHVVQSIKNHSLLVGSPLVFYGFESPSPSLKLLAVLIVYAVTRAAGFTLFLTFQ